MEDHPYLAQDARVCESSLSKKWKHETKLNRDRRQQKTRINTLGYAFPRWKSNLYAQKLEFIFVFWTQKIQVMLPSSAYSSWTLLPIKVYRYTKKLWSLCQPTTNIAKLHNLQSMAMTYSFKDISLDILWLLNAIVDDDIILEVATGSWLAADGHRKFYYTWKERGGDYR